MCVCVCTDFGYDIKPFDVEAEKYIDFGYEIKPSEVVEGEEYNNFGYYLPTPPLGQDMTQGQFLSGV